LTHVIVTTPPLLLPPLPLMPSHPHKSKTKKLVNKMMNMRTRNMMRTNYTTYFICLMIEVDAMSLKKIMSRQKKA